MVKKCEPPMPGSMEDELKALFDSPGSTPRDAMPVGEIEYILKIPRTIDPAMAELMNERHRLFVEEEIKHFSRALSDAERLPSENTRASRRPR